LHLSTCISFLASFSSPESIGTTPESLLWLLPLSLAVAIIYKVTKLENIELAEFTKEVVVLFASIVVFMSLIGAGFVFVGWIINL
jgi:hypothetical protein